MARATPKDQDALKWLRDCGWHGWSHDLLHNSISSSHGDEWESPSDLRSWLESLKRWPRLIKDGESSQRGRNVPPLSYADRVGVLW